MSRSDSPVQLYVEEVLAVTDEVIRWHLAGQDDQGRDFVMGAYPMLPDETTFFLVTFHNRQMPYACVELWARGHYVASTQPQLNSGPSYSS